MQNSKVIVSRYGGPEVLQLLSEPLRVPNEGEVRVKVRCSGVALADVMRREGKYPSSPVPPFTPGYDVVGHIDAVGAEVETRKVGETVACFFQGTGGYATYVYARADELIVVPSDVDLASVSAILLNYVTAYQMLHRIAQVEAGESILIHGASGGVGTALLELGRLTGVHMYGTTSSEKQRVVQAFGAIAIDYRQEDFVKRLRALAPNGIDAVFDAVGGQNYERSLQTLGKHGRFVGYGYTSILSHGEAQDWSNQWQQMRQRGQTPAGQPIHLYSITSLQKERPNWYREDVKVLLSLLVEGKIHPLIAARVPFAHVAEAHRLLEGFGSVGKIVLVHEE